MEIRIVKKKEVVFEEHEARIIMNCLNYCKHRLDTKPDCGLSKSSIRKTQLEKLRLALIAAFNPPTNTEN